MQPLLTICLTTFNEEANIERCLTHLLRQSYRDFQLFVLDNCSTDATVEIARRVAATDSRVIVRTNLVNVGPIQNFQRCYWLPQTDFVMLASANDHVEADYVETLLNVLTSDPSIAIAYSRVTASSDAPRTYVHAVQDERVARCVSVVRDFTSGHILYGIMRRAAIDWVAPVPYRNGADHIFVAEAALFGRIHCVDRPLYHRMPHPERDIRRAAWLCSDYGYRLTQKMPSFAGEVGVLPPFLELLNGYFEMFDRARITNDEKSTLKAQAATILRARFGSTMNTEARDLLSHAVGFLQHAAMHGTRIDEHLHASAIVKSLWVAALGAPDLRLRIQGILQSLVPIAVGEIKP